MSRNKKSRKPGSTGDVDLIVTRNRTESDVEGRLRKKLKKRKGLKTGNRNSEASEAQFASGKQKRDPRLGSKKKIPLVVDTKKPTKQEKKLSAEKELEMLENDAQLTVLLNRIEQGEKLGSGLQNYVDERLDRIETLMKQLGLYIDEEGDDSEDELLEIEEVVATKPNKASKANSEQDLLDSFENLDLDDFKH
ncbi:Der GTPase-activating protein YihI [Vibrio marisflavi]|uniref:Der GTPase-activating protein YihI n=1 Tax=Vibrio marisflavi CECT 7928 TaxID=634439 RepID=A0ABM9A949_9VIBR|nr:Der GTPase-activating protein YihI [Vibrio marisflavi]CAH0542042.1 Der GTPase-activating protein YihI [Vibrio marisflavi CECT 7928]